MTPVPGVPPGEDFPVLTLIVAVYAALVATGGLGWQIWAARRRHRSMIQVRTSWATSGGVREVVVQVINFSDFPVKIRNWGWFAERLGPRPRSYSGRPDGIEIPAHDSVTIREPRDMALREIDLIHERVVSWIQLTTGEEFRSGPTPSPRHRDVDPRFAAHEAEHGKPPP